MNKEDYQKYKKAEAIILENNEKIEILTKKRNKLQQEIKLKNI